MKYSIVLLFFVTLGVINLNAQTLLLSEIEMQEALVTAENFINDQNEEFKDPEHSPLHDDSIAHFDGLDYFPINP